MWSGHSCPLILQLPLSGDEFPVTGGQTFRVYEGGWWGSKKGVPASGFEHLAVEKFRRVAQAFDLAGITNTVGAPSFAHFSFLAIWPLISYSVLRKWPNAARWLLLFNLMVNAYPIMLQRYNRIRLHKLLTQNKRQAIGA